MHLLVLLHTAVVSDMTESELRLPALLVGRLTLPVRSHQTLVAIAARLCYIKSLKPIDWLIELHKSKHTKIENQN